MPIVDYTLKLLGLGESMRRWQGVLTEVDDKRREKVARYADEIAGTLGRAVDAFEQLAKEPADPNAERAAIREFGRLAGYVENIVSTLDGRIDGRRLAGAKRRLETLVIEGLMVTAIRKADARGVERLTAAEGYFRALADGLRA